jgi:acyl-CoA hydrolase
VSKIELVELMEPGDVNIRGFVHGGVIMRLADTAAGLAAVRHAAMSVVTASVDSLAFHAPVHVGDLVHLIAELTRVWRTSMEVEVEVWREIVSTGDSQLTTTAFFTMVGVDEQGNPVPVPPLIAETDDQRRRAAEADQRRARRLELRGA